ncbi:hypothetical protein Hanom_Chr11g00968861 [Helianthus anomalus]
MENTVAEIVLKLATRMFNLSAIFNTQYRKQSYNSTLIGTFIPRSNCSAGSSIFVCAAFINPGKSAARFFSDGITLGMVANLMLGGLGSLSMNPSHSSVTTTVMNTSEGLRRAMSLHRFIIELMWPLPGYGIATTWWLKHSAIG